MTTFNNYSEEQINRILTSYKNKLDKENKYYHEVSKNKEDFIIKNRARAKAHYEKKGKDMKKEKYELNKDIMKGKSLFNYYKRRDNIEGFKKKHPETYNILFAQQLIN